MSSAGLPKYSESFIDRVFQVFDVDRSGTVSLKELCTGLSVLSHGTPEEKLNMSFNVYDINGDGQISAEEFHVLLTSLEQGMVLTGKTNVAQVVQQFLHDFDINADEMISLTEFKLAALKEPLFRELLESPDSDFDLSRTHSRSNSKNVSPSSPGAAARGPRTKKGRPARTSSNRSANAKPSSRGSKSPQQRSTSLGSEDAVSISGAQQASPRSSNSLRAKPGRGKRERTKA
ncbi:uncharacterized protein AMSG_02839 [Thecamonas trahens ATCC 50062]|uniref:EF-hand domain-containing protein n=1 Tax=Thecamonas trahens ATCC 50062 TaxID=461836 RepID=A0A0L0D275_THETB|nr:hypothetical protein AMSG_02839 [Thecamonas trahens ATCC 50062]KNC46387.1 hypothetical protein AMSG_02839 [Thecamonas trahens ATCC 50062]|eukprot:XP_013760680.1 hypothetical protein AMSG_02839 [Thecamonas trahens ATCC 50062]